MVAFFYYRFERSFHAPLSSFSSLIAVITLVVAFCYTSTGTDAEFDELKALVEKYMSEKDAHDTAVKVMTEAEAVRSRERQEQSDAVEQATLEILNRNAEAILPNPDGSDGYNLFESFIRKRPSVRLRLGLLFPRHPRSYQ